MDNNNQAQKESYYSALRTGPTVEAHALCMHNPKWAYKWARDIDKKPSHKARMAVLKDPIWAYRYARDVEGYHPDTYAVCVGGATESTLRGVQTWTGVKLRALYRKNVKGMPTSGN